MFELMLCVAVVSLILEIIFPALFFLNFTFAATVCAILGHYIDDAKTITILFCVLSLISILILRPILLKTQNKIKQKTGIEEKYIGKTALVVEDIDKTKGLITIYDERWQARNVEDGVIPAGSTIEIVGNKSIVMQVKKI